MSLKQKIISVGLLEVFLVACHSERTVLEEKRQAHTVTSSQGDKRDTEAITKALLRGWNVYSHQKIDEYGAFVNSLKSRFPADLNTRLKYRDFEDLCKEQTLRNQLKPPHFDYRPLEYSCFGMTGHSVVCLEKVVALQAQQEQKEKFAGLLQELANYEALQRFGEAARIYRYLGDRHQEYISGRGCTTEDIIALTSRENWPQLANHYSYDLKDLFSAGKVEWLLGHREKAITLITQSPEFEGMVRKSRRLLYEGKQDDAEQFLWEEQRLPFYKDLIDTLK